MKIIALKDTIRKDVPIYYRKLYTGVVVIEMSRGPENYRIDFTIEYKPTGQKEITVSFIDKVDYPLIPLNKELKQFIDNLDSGGGLPD
ncbi:MAG: hypothetical protein LBH44_00885 [Treponema sp.]|jgi:hypothetical protein|nr:hypothetical protein [Treponema sp.]